MQLSNVIYEAENILLKREKSELIVLQKKKKGAAEKDNHKAMNIRNQIAKIGCRSDKYTLKIIIERTIKNRKTTRMFCRF